MTRQPPGDSGGRGTATPVRRERESRSWYPASQPRVRPFYVRALGLRHLEPGGALCFMFFEGALILATLLALAELVSWWAVILLPASVALMVKVNDLVAVVLARSAARVPISEQERFRRELAPAAGRAPVPASSLAVPPRAGCPCCHELPPIETTDPRLARPGPVLPSPEPADRLSAPGRPGPLRPSSPGSTGLDRIRGAVTRTATPPLRGAGGELSTLSPEPGRAYQETGDGASAPVGPPIERPDRRSVGATVEPAPADRAGGSGHRPAAGPPVVLAALLSRPARRRY